jgi:uncharacterized membrane protein YhaH (DUF805 family)
VRTRQRSIPFGIWSGHDIVVRLRFDVMPATVLELVKRKGDDMKWYLDVLKNYAEFDGRAGREEYWYFTLINVIISISLIVTNTWAWIIYSLLVIIPTLSVTVRRLHDTDRNGWWILLALIPVLGIVILYLMALDSKPGQNQYGFNPKDVIA